MKMIYPDDLREGDVFLHNGSEYTAIESGTPKESEYQGLMNIWVTKREFFIYPEEHYTYGYTNASVETMKYDKKIPVICNLLDERRR